MKLIDDNGKTYEILRFDTVKGGDIFICINNDDGALAIEMAETDLPDNFGSFILKRVEKDTDERARVETEVGG